MRTLTVTLFCLLFSNTLFTQVNNLLHCSQIAVFDIEKTKQLERSYKKLLGTKNQKFSYTLPIVIHVLYDDVGNIPDQQVDDAINYLNSAFANLAPYHPMTGVDTELAFCLAAQNPEGNFTTGINRIQTPFATSINTAEEIVQLSNWNSSDYINIYVVPSLCNALGEDCNFIVGYASAPSLHGLSKDGIYIQTDYFGISPENTAALVHEMGHYLGLLHTFQGGCENSDCLEDGDKVCDTPPDNSIAYVLCGENMNSCDTDVNFGDPNNPLGLDFPDMTWNYMDYGFSCYSAFTQGQKDRMHFFLENARQSLLESDACVPGCTLPIVGSFEVLDTFVEVGSNIIFTNNTINGESFEWFIDDMLVSNTIDFNYTFNQTGTFLVKLIVSNNDINCVQEYTQAIEVFCPIEPSINVSAFTIEVGESVSFFGESTIANFEWYMDGNLISTETAFALQFEEEGVFEISLLSFQNNPFCEEEVSVLIEVVCPVDLNLSIYPNILNVGDSILLINNSNNASYIEWFIDGVSFGNNDTLFFLPSDAGDYLINLSGTNELCEEALFQNIIVQGDCEGTFNYFQNEYTSVGGFNAEWGNNPILFDSANNQLIVNYEFGRLSTANLNGDLITSKRFTSNLSTGVNIGGVELTDDNKVIAIINKNNSLNVISLNMDFSTNWVKTINSALPLTGGGGLIRLSNNTYSMLYFTGTAPWNGQFNIINFSENGEINWSQYFPLMGMFVPNKRKIVPLNDNSTVALVTKWDADNRLLKFDSNGNKIWEKAVFNALGEVQFISNIFTVSDKIFVFPQNSFANNQSIICLNANGEKLWERAFTEPFDFELRAVFSSNENNELLVTGQIQSFPDRTGIIKLSEDGNYLEHYEFDFDEILELQFIENSLFIAATTQFPYDDVLVKLDSINNQQLCSSRPNNTPIIFEDSNQFIIDTIAASFSFPSNQTFEPDTICPIVDNTLFNNRICGDFLVDAILKILEIDTCQSQLNITIEICNEGIGTIFDNTPIAFYNGNPSNINTSLIFIDEIGQSIFTDSCFITDFVIPVSPFGQLYAIINDNGIAPIPFSTETVGWDFEQIECKYNNNVDSIFYTPYLPSIIDNNIDTLEFCGAIDTTLSVPFTFQFYNWNNNIQDSILTINTPGHYIVTVTDDCGFEQIKEWEVRQFLPASILDLGQDISLCEGSIQILAVPNQYPSIIWQDGSFDTKFTAWHSGIYWVEVTDACGNIQRDSIEITLNEEFNLDLGEDVILCQGDTFTVSAMLDFDNYQWSPKENLSCDTCSTITFVVDSTVTIALQASNDDGCYSSDTLNIQVFQHQEVFIDSFLCDTESISFNGIEINDGESYTFDLQNVAGCDSTVTVQYNSLDSRQTEETINICPNESALIFDTLISESGVYSKIFSTYQGCDSIHSINLFVYEDFDFSIETIPTCATEDNGQATILTEGGTPPFSYDWLTISGEESVVNNLPFGTYQVIVSDSAGCSQTADFSIPFYPEEVAAFHCEPQVFAPNVFSPNDDSINDFFYLQSNERVVAVLSLKIFDRYGELVFENKDIVPNEESAGWNGIFNRELMNPQVFIWQAEVQFFSGERKVFYGDVVLIR